MTLASVDDVKRVLKRVDDSTIDDELLYYLGLADTVVNRLAGDRKFGATGTVTETFYNVRFDSRLYVSDVAPTSIVVNVFMSGLSTGSLYVENTHYTVERYPYGTKIRFLMRNIDAPWSNEESGRHLSQWYERVTVSYTASNSIPEIIREATAILAAAFFDQSVDDASGQGSEGIGGYSRSRGSPQDYVIPPRVRTLVAMYTKRHTRST